MFDVIRKEGRKFGAPINGTEEREISGRVQPRDENERI